MPAHTTVRHPISLYELTSKAEDELGSLDVASHLEDRRQELIASRVADLLESKSWTTRTNEKVCTPFYPFKL